MADPLADWWVHTVLVERFTGDDAYSKTYDPPVPVTGYYSGKTVYSGGQAVAGGRFAFPAGVAYIPVESKVTLPDLFGGRVVRVVSSAVGDAGGQPTPNHQMIEVI